ncbi:MAG: ECF transporter S component [Oscillospiraceae bacterium]
MSTKKRSTTKLVQFSILIAIEAIFCFTPLGSLPALGPIVATLAMIPVVITAILLGTKAGTLMGFIAAAFSFIVWTFMPPNPLIAFVFTPFYSFGDFHGNFASILICFVPRILTGAVAGIVFKVLKEKLPNKNILTMAIAAALGSLTNTFLVMGGIWVFFGSQYSSLAGTAMIAIIGMTILTSGIPEAVVSAVISPAICQPVNKILKRKIR